MNKSAFEKWHCKSCGGYFMVGDGWDMDISKKDFDADPHCVLCGSGEIKKVEAEK